MSGGITAESVLNDIEFELIQGTLGSDPLSEVVEDVQRFQNKRRAQLFASKHSESLPTEELNTFFQINDMLLGLCREMIADLQSMRLALRRSYALSPRPTVGQAPPSSSNAAPTDLEERSADSPPSLWIPGRAVRKVSEIRSAMQADSLDLHLQIGHSGLPLVGRLLNRLRTYLHTHGILYARVLAGKQAPINRTYGDWLLYLGEVSQQQQEEIALLRAELAALRAEPEIAGPGRGSAQ